MLSPGEHAAIVAHAVQTFPKECVGFVLRRAGASRVMACRNAAWAPAGTFAVAPLDHVRLLRYWREGWRTAAMYHSHPYGSVALSHRDVATMAPDGCYAFPGALQVVVALDEQGPTRMAAFGWDTARRAFVLAGSLSYLATTEPRRTAYRQLAVLPLVRADDARP